MPVDERFLGERVDALLLNPLEERVGRVVPATADVALKNGAVKVDATFLYADLAGSAKLSEVCPWETTAKIIRAFLDISTRLIIARGGHVRSFDGDRVMGVFLSNTKNSDASKCGREIHWVVRKVLHEKAKAKFRSISNNGIEIRHCVGIDTGEVRAVRAGMRDNNDLIWIGKAASFSAKLSDVREIGYHTFISERVFKKLSSDAKKEGDTDLWTKDSFNFAGKQEVVYKSNHWKKP